MRFAYAILTYFALFCLLHGTPLGSPVHTRPLTPGELAQAAVSLPALGLGMAAYLETWRIVAAAVLALGLAFAAMTVWRYAYGWVLLTLALLVLQTGGIFGVYAMGSV